mmetsp:Transcript_41248/g.62320  ORF Transcript_41248/g.62320 Transcript_41248/m.62320 type:complete len:206 (+) Transcript_41248:86-703(+)
MRREYQVVPPLQPSASCLAAEVIHEQAKAFENQLREIGTPEEKVHSMVRALKQELVLRAAQQPQLRTNCAPSSPWSDEADKNRRRSAGLAGPTLAGIGASVCSASPLPSTCQRSCTIKEAPISKIPRQDRAQTMFEEMYGRLEAPTARRGPVGQGVLQNSDAQCHLDHRSIEVQATSNMADMNLEDLRLAIQSHVRHFARSYVLR